MPPRSSQRRANWSTLGTESSLSAVNGVVTLAVPGRPALSPHSRGLRRGCLSPVLNMVFAASSAEQGFTLWDLAGNEFARCPSANFPGIAYAAAFDEQGQQLIVSQGGTLDLVVYRVADLVQGVIAPPACSARSRPRSVCRLPTIA